jgi:hypothetical protein
VLVRPGYWTTTPIRPRFHSAVAPVATHRRPTIRTMNTGARPRHTGNIRPAIRNRTQDARRNPRRAQTFAPSRALARSR